MRRFFSECISATPLKKGKNNPCCSLKTTRVLMVFALLGILTSCSYPSRNEYDPMAYDELECAELYRIDQTLQRYDTNKDAFCIKYIQNEFFPNTTDNEMNSVEWSIYEASIDSENDYNHDGRDKQISYDKAQDLNVKLGYFEIWYTAYRSHLEGYLYENSDCDYLFPTAEQMDLLLNYVDSSNSRLKNLDFYKENLNQMYTDVYKTLNAPRMAYATLENDDKRGYQIWKLYTQTSAIDSDGLAITVMYDEDQEEDYIRLFHPN